MKKILMLVVTSFSFLEAASPLIPLNLAEHTITNDTAIIKAFAPEVRLSGGEEFFCDSVNRYVIGCSLDEWIVRDKTGRVLISRAALILSDLGNPQYQGEALYLNPLKTKAFRQGELPRNNVLLSPCYAQLVRIGSDKAIIQYAFFYAWNEPSPLLGAIGRKEKAVQTGVKKVTGFFTKKVARKERQVDIGELHVGAHEGDWEHIDVHVATDPSNKLYIERILMSRHRQRSWAYSPVQFAGPHPIIYASKGGHANYGAPVNFINSLADVANGKGPRWLTWVNVTNVGTFDNLTPGNEWVKYQGQWGEKRGPRMGGGATWWFKRGSYPTTKAALESANIPQPK